MKNLTINDIRRSYETSPDTDFYKYSLARYIFRPLSFYVAWIAIKLKISPNQITFLSWFVLFLGCFNYATQYFNYLFFSFSMIFLWALFDYVDGTMARALSARSKFGHFIDVVGAYYLFAFLPIAIALGTEGAMLSNVSTFIFASTGLTVNFLDPILLGSMSAISNLLLRLTLLRGQVTFDVNVRDIDETSNTASLIAWIEALASPRGFFFPLLLLCEYFNALDVFVLIYALYYCLSLLIYTPIYCLKNSDK
jgi:phosphatidylglycerophosphate synthase